MIDKIKLLKEIIESCTDCYADNRNEIAKALFLLNEIKESIIDESCFMKFENSNCNCKVKYPNLGMDKLKDCKKGFKNKQ